MGLFDHAPQPGAPYLLASLLSLWAFLHCFELPDGGNGDDENDTRTLKLVVKNQRGGGGRKRSMHEFENGAKETTGTSILSMHN